MARDRFATRTAILDSASAILSSPSAPQLGVNSLADAAKCDKVLIYRYFGGLEGVLAALGAERMLWPRVEVGTGNADEESSLADAVHTALLEEWAALDDTGLARAGATAETTSSGALATATATQRAESHARTVAALKDAHRIPPYIDLPALIELLSAALTLFALRAAHNPATESETAHPPQPFDPATPHTRRRIEKMLSAITRALLQSDGG